MALHGYGAVTPEGAHESRNESRSGSGYCCSGLTVMQADLRSHTAGNEARNHAWIADELENLTRTMREGFASMQARQATLERRLYMFLGGFGVVTWLLMWLGPEGLGQIFGG